MKTQESGTIHHGEIVLVCASNRTAYAAAKTVEFDGKYYTSHDISQRALAAMEV